MQLTGKEQEIMTVLWNSELPLTTTEIIETSPNRTWQDRSIFVIMQSLVSKGAVVLDRYKPTAGKHARAYKPIITTEQYALSSLGGMEKKGMKFDIDVLIEGLLKKKEVKEG